MAKQNLITLQLLTISGILFSVLVTLIAYRQFVLPVGQADLTVTAPDVEPPYLRIVADDARSTMSEKVFRIFANTAGSRVTAADILLRYNPSILEVLPDSITPSGALAISYIPPEQSEGELQLSLFSNPERGEPLLSTNADQEIELARITFQVVDPSVPLTTLELVHEQSNLDDTNLIVFEDPREEFPTDVLQSVNQLVVSLQ